MSLLSRSRSFSNLSNYSKISSIAGSDTVFSEQSDISDDLTSSTASSGLSSDPTVNRVSSSSVNGTIIVAYIFFKSV